MMRILHTTSALLAVLLASTVCGEVLRLEVPGSSHAVPVKIFLPETSAPAPVVLFSHGLGGSREGADYLGERWSAERYAVVALQHPGSDKTVWQDQPFWKIRRTLNEAANLKSFTNRIGDVRTVLDYLESAGRAAAHPLHGRLDTARIAMAGHSFGAITSQALMGQDFRAAGNAPFADSRIDCFILMSPSASKDLSNEAAFGGVSRPVLCMTGTRDASPLRKEVTPESRTEVYRALPDGQAYQVVFDRGAHSIFGDYRRNDPRYHTAIQTITTAFLDAYLKADADALEWLRSDDARTPLIAEDLWDWK